MSTAPSSTEAEYTGPMFDEHDKQYLKVFAGLVALTAFEVYLSYSPLKDAKAGLALPLMGLALIKFIIVAGFFMHLKFDTPLLRRLFIVGGVLASFCYVMVLGAMGRFSGTSLYAAFGIYAALAAVLLGVWVFRGNGNEAGEGGEDSPAAHAPASH
jgi:cytochrome c oxidase subunit IV